MYLASYNFFAFRYNKSNVLMKYHGLHELCEQTILEKRKPNIKFKKVCGSDEFRT